MGLEMVSWDRRYQGQCRALWLRSEVKATGFAVTRKIRHYTAVTTLRLSAAGCPPWIGAGPLGWTCATPSSTPRGAAWGL